MKIIILILCLIISSPVIAKEKGVKPKIILHEIGEKHKDSWVFGVEANQFESATYLNPSITFSSKYDIDVSIISQNIPVWKNGAQEFQDDTYFAVSKTFDFYGTNIIIGSQNGYPLYVEDNSKFGPGKMHQFYYFTSVKQINYWLKIHGGSYYINSSLSTTTNYFGGIGGFEIKYDDFIISGDYISAHSSISGASITAGYLVEPWFNPYIGVGVPETNSGNEFYGVVGFSISTGSLK